jgi:uroporphyrin-III C-methyltransferase/precorrin-2 dehydrogenase/sirohydrochlorin ferrochelatase
MRNLLPLFLDVTGRDVLLVGGGSVAAAKLGQLAAAKARVHVVAPEVSADLEQAASCLETNDIAISHRRFSPGDLDGAWLVIAAATPEVNRQVAEAAEVRRLFVNAVDDPANATAFLSGVVRRDGVTIAISTSGDAPALTALVREGLDAVLPSDLDTWMRTARAQRSTWRREAVPMEQRKPRLLRALNRLYETGEPRVPWLSGPEDSWL